MEKTCIDCGFLTINGKEIIQSDRIMLSQLAKGQSCGTPANPEKTRCFKNLWVNYDLSYVGDCFEGVMDELNSERNKCTGIFKYMAGYDPEQHLEHQLEQRKEKLQWRIAKLSFLGALFGGIAGTIIILILQWLISYLR